MIRCRPLACLLMLLIAGACARRTEIIGRLPDGAVVEAGGEGGPGLDVPAGDGAGDAPGDPVLALCPSPGLQNLIPRPMWTCGDGCWNDPRVDRAVFAAPARPGAAMPPVISYPLANSVHPTNLGPLTVQFSRASVQQTSFRIRLDAGQGVSYDLFVPYTEPFGSATPYSQLQSLHVIPEQTWRYLGQQHPGAELTITVAAYDATANVVDVSAPLPVRFAVGPVEGALYYLTVEPPNNGIQRHLLGTAQVEPLVRPGQPPFSFNCVGCHSVSRDGGTLAFAAKYEYNLTLARTDKLSEPTILPKATPDSLAVAPVVSPDGRYVVARNAVDRSLAVYSGSTGLRLGLVDETFLEGRIDFPQWSPAGDELVATRATSQGQPAASHSAVNGELVIIPFRNETLQKPQPLPFEAGQSVHAYPAWSPDARWIVFTSSPMGSETVNNPETRLRLMNRATRAVYELTSAFRGLGERAKWPRFAPTALGDCQTMFLTFQSRLDYGFLRQNSVAVDRGFSQLWMSQIDLSRLPGDPSSAPIWLPFQDHMQRNILPTWSDFIPCSAGCPTGTGCDRTSPPERCVPR